MPPRQVDREERAGQIVVAATEVFARWFDPSLNPVRMAERFIDALLRGLAPPGTRR